MRDQAAQLWKLALENEQYAAKLEAEAKLK